MEATTNQLQQWMDRERSAASCKRVDCAHDGGGDMASEAARVFSMFDAENTGKIPWDDVNLLLHALGLPPTTAEKVGSFTSADFIETASKLAPPKNSVQSFDLAFQAMTGGKDLTFDTFMDCLNRCNVRISEAQAREVLTFCDLDGDGFVNADDFSRVMTFLAEIS